MNTNKNKDVMTNTTNARTIHQQLQELAAREITALTNQVDQLQPAERLRFLLAILPYVTPKQLYYENEDVQWR